MNKLGQPGENTVDPSRFDSHSQVLAEEANPVSTDRLVQDLRKLSLNLDNAQKESIAKAVPATSMELSIAGKNSSYRIQVIIIPGNNKPQRTFKETEIAYKVTWQPKK